MYATTTSLYTLLVGTNSDSATSDLLAKLIVHSENEINKYLSKRYNIAAFNTTSTAVPPLVTSLCEQLTEGKFYIRNSRGGKEVIKSGQELIKGAIENLELIAKYELDLLDSSGSVIADMSQTAYRIMSNTTGYASTFNEDDELNWAVDQGKLDDISNERDS